MRYELPGRAAQLVFLLAISLTACRSEVRDEPTGIAPEVLRPIAEQQTNERISQARALLAQINLTKEQRAASQPVTIPDAQLLIGKVMSLVELNPDDARGNALLRSFGDLTVRKPFGARKSEYQEVLAWLDRRRGSLRTELMLRLVQRTLATDKGFLLCVEGVQRHYEKGTDGRFARLPDKAGSC